jgi:hypothetical protein
VYPFGKAGNVPELVDGGAGEFARYAGAARGVHTAIVRALTYATAPDSGRFKPFDGTIGAIAASQAIVGPLGPWHPVFAGTVPLTIQPKIVTPEPWADPRIGL